MSDANQPKVLVIDDDELMLTVVRKMLEGQGLSVDVAQSAREALDRLPKNGYNAILCDMLMPGMSGAEFYQQVNKEFPEYKRRVVFLTGDIASEATWEFIEERHLPYVLKPFGARELHQKLRELVGEPFFAPSSPEKPSNQRRHRRIVVKAAIQVRKKRWATRGPEITAVSNVSKEGVYFVTNRQYRVGTEVQVSFPYTGPQDIEQEGYVVRVDERRGGRWGVAIALGPAAVAFRSGLAGGPEERRRQRILAMADLAGQRPQAHAGIEEVADVADLKRKMESEREQARRLAEELADLSASHERVAAQRDHLAAEEAHFKLQLRELTAAKATLTQMTRDLKQHMQKLQKQLAVSEGYRFQATHDSLTGVWNRAAILDILRGELQRAQREGIQVGVVLADLDHFKAVNDTYGHLAGDAMLREAGRRMASCVRLYDSVGRYGGEEFLIVLPACNVTSTLNQAERIRACLSEEPVNTREGRISSTMSLGVAAGSGENEMETLLRAADAALYRAKRAGRNRAEVAAAMEAHAPHLLASEAQPKGEEARAGPTS